MGNNFVPTHLVEQIAADVRELKLNTAQAGVAFAKVAANRGREEYAEHAEFLTIMSPEQRVTLCALVEANR